MTYEWYYSYIKHFTNNRFVSEIVRKVMTQINNIVLCAHDSTIVFSLQLYKPIIFV